MTQKKIIFTSAYQRMACGIMPALFRSKRQVLRIMSLLEDSDKNDPRAFEVQLQDRF